MQLFHSPTLLVLLAASAAARPSPFERDVYGQRGAAVPPQTTEATTDFQPPRETAFQAPSYKLRTLLAGEDFSHDEAPNVPDEPVQIYFPERSTTFPPIAELKTAASSPAGDAALGNIHSHKHQNPKEPVPCKKFVEDGSVSGCVRYTVHHHETLRSLARALGIETHLLRHINPQLRARSWHVHTGWVINIPMGLAPPPMSRRDFADAYAPDVEETLAPRSAPLGVEAPKSSHKRHHHSQAPKTARAPVGSLKSEYDSESPEEFTGSEYWTKKGVTPRGAPIFDRLPGPFDNQPITIIPVDKPPTSDAWDYAPPVEGMSTLVFSPPPPLRYIRPQNTVPDRFGFNAGPPAQGQRGGEEMTEVP